MRHAAWITLFACALAGCGKGAKTQIPAPPSPRSSEAEPPAATGQMVSHGLQLFLYDAKSTGSVPRFEMTADTATRSPDETWSIEGAKATVHTRNEQNDIHLEAGKGRLDQRTNKESAFLEGGVVMHTSDSKVEMQNAQWLNREGVIKTDDPVSIQSPDLQMKASSMRYYPDQDKLLLTNVSGTINLKESAKQ